MRRKAFVIRSRGVRALLLCLCVAAVCAPVTRAAAGDGPFVALPLVEPGDLTYFAPDGTRLVGAAALSTMAARADLIAWVAGNQFVAVPDLVTAFQKAHPGVGVGTITLPPELELAAIRAGGWRFDGRDYPGLPDVYGSVSVLDLRTTLQIHRYVVYAHNELELMVAPGNPQHIARLSDLVRPDLRVVLPNPIDEGIMTVYARPVLVRLGLWEQLSQGESCRSCAVGGHVYFAAVHHREAPARIAGGQADVALVWSTEVEEARRKGAPVAGVRLPVDESARDDVAYVAGVLESSPHRRLADAFLEFLAGPEGQAAYAGHGFVAASTAERAVRTLP